MCIFRCVLVFLGFNSNMFTYFDVQIFLLATGQVVCDMCYLVTSLHYRRKGGISSKVFQAVQEQCFCSRVTPFGVDMHKNKYNTVK